ncbi:uncharacterized protein CCOS01_11048 [Colletotrichum costaricense]|uniref:RZ-type domain-containing protein n=1 Tax=Colletotrichum costaricense TaxID=1209916 RepID=A0AAI9YQB1_9PEZI|nr:uncharacterized protein CCOS01_11048 [Colletotrichum costaricense]KAK1519397.1 hypothetical protein CCOS01_11048 [Colletotrichum costaricense]
MTRISFDGHGETHRRGSDFPGNYQIKFDGLPDRNLVDAKQEVTSQWDIAKLRRVERANVGLVVYWIRKELLSSLAPEAADAPRLAGEQGNKMDRESADNSSLTYIWLSIDGWKGIQMAYLAYQQQGPVVGDIHVCNKPDRGEQGQWRISNPSPDHPPAIARRIDGRTANAPSRARNPERERLFQWKRLRPQPRQVSLLWDDTTSNFFRTAISLVEQDVSLAQEVVKEMAADGRLPLVRDVIEGVASARTPEAKALLWESRISPLFRVLLHPTVVDSVVLEQETAVLYRLLLGVDATRLKTLFNFVFDVVDHWCELPFEDTAVSAMEALALSCGVLAKVINTSTSNIVNALFHPIVEGIKLRLDVFGNKDSDFHTLQATRHLDYVYRRLGIGQTLVDAVHISASSGAVAEFTLSQDLPGKLSKRRERHDNDHQDISDIKLMPTHQEIMSSRDEYLPVANPAQHHLQGLRGLLDRHFRLLREDTLHDLRSAIRTTVESNVKVRDIRTRVVAYDNAFAVDMTFDRWSGVEFVIQIDQPRPTRGLDKLQRGTWWAGKRLMDGALVCIVDEVGGIFFFQVSKSTIRTPKDENQPGQGDIQEENKNDAPRYSLLDDENHAYVHLHLVDTGIDEIKRSLRWFKTMQIVRQHRRLLEFPSILLASFTPPLKALQNMSKTLDLPFQGLLTLRAGSRTADNPPPLYSRRPDFSFNLSCLSTDGRELSYTPGDAINPSRLSRHSSLDKTQSEAILNSLRRSFALIQGPPGTGKSYTGEALIKVLLANKSKAKLGPIMCVCYTNHALDQLLEHLLDGGVQNIIRIGSRSKSDRLAPVNLRAVARDMTRTAAESRALYKSVETLDGDTEQIRGTLSDFIFSRDNEKIRLHLAQHYPAQHEELMGPTLPNFDDEKERWQTVDYSRGNVFKKWLAGGAPTNTTRPLRRLRQLKLADLYHQERILLYQEWLDEVLRGEIDSLSNMHKVYQEHKENNNKIRSSIDLRCLQEANIIGVTTTGLATNLDLLRRVHGKVLVCEEAGEVLEAHLLTALLPTVEHAILIGDHLQLRPQIQDWRLQRANPAGFKYSLDVSLFERLVQPPPNVPSIPFSVLDTQRRMHPSIAELVRSTLYPSLSDSENVQDYPEIPGLARRLFWLHHESPESGGKSDQDSVETSYSNNFEIELVSALVSHLLRQGVYKSGEIAVLTPYLGQLNKLRQKLSSVMQIVINDRDMDDLAEMEPASAAQGSFTNVGQAAKTNALSGVRAATVDNFQGEEANVVIISLVRSNNDNRCGFLSTSNRINVLLSRAKHGMYIIGNSHTSSHVPMWAQVTEILQNGGNFGNRLELQCPRHLQNKGFVSQPEDFLRFSPDGGCAAPCDWIPCTKRCTEILKCGHQCPSVCGERCPAEKYCQTCAADDIKNRVVDLILMDDYVSVDLDKEPCIFPDCGHFYTYTTMDGQMGLRDLYDVSPEGVPTAVKSGSHPFSVTNIKVCPDCRGSLRNISRYGRIVRRGLLDESTRKFISWAHSVKQKLTDAFFAAQDNLQKMEKNKFSFPTTQLGFPMSQSAFALRGSRQQQMTHLFKLTGNTRHAVLKTLRNQVTNFLGSVRKEEQPYQRVAHLVWHVNKRRQTSDYSFDESAIQMGGMLDAMTLSLRCDLLLVSDYISLCRNMTDNDSDGAKSASIDPMPYIKDCQRLIETARMRNYSRLQVEGHICLAMFCYFAPPDDAKPTTDAPEAPKAENSSTKESMIKLGEDHLLEAEKIIKANPSAATMASEVETARRMLCDGVFYSEVSTDEMRAVYAAMSKEFSGTGHWYTCRNGHPFTIGECGMAMQQTVCPECNAPVGGRNHSSAEGVRHAVEIDALARGIGRMGF